MDQVSVAEFYSWWKKKGASEAAKQPAIYDQLSSSRLS